MRGIGNNVKISQIIVNQLPEFIKDTIKVVEASTSPVSKNGSYTRSDRTITVTSANHGLYTSDRINANFISGSASSGFYNVYEVIDQNTFIIVDISSGTTSGSLSFEKSSNSISFGQGSYLSPPASYEKFVEFLKQYYISQEYQGGPIDIVDNLNLYLSLDNLIPEVLAIQPSLVNNIDSESSEIVVTSTKGFPDRYGLIRIDDEIITYTSKNATSFFGCIRGFSGVTNLHDELNYEELVFSTSNSSSHAAGTKLENLSTLFLKEFFKKAKYSLVPGLENVDFYQDLNIGNFLKEAKSLYECKGTEESFKILFRVLFGTDVNILDLEDLILKPSSAKYYRREICFIDAIFGNPANLKGQIIRKTTDSLVSASISNITPITFNNKTYYKLYLFVGYDDSSSSITGDFTVTPSTKVSNNVTIDENSSETINVDSTVGFPSSGYFYYDQNKIYYTDKSINQFFDCYSESGQVNILKTNNIVSSETYYSYENGDINKRVEFRVTGTLNDVEFLPAVDYKDKFNYIPGDEIFVKNLGEIIENPEENPSNIEVFSNSLVYNTNCRFNIDKTTITGNQFSVFTNIDKSNLKVGDKIEILERGTELVVPGLEEILVTSINDRDVSTNVSIFSILNDIENKGLLVITEDYDFRRIQNTASINESSNFSIKYGQNKVLSNVLNLYRDDEDLYVASNSLPDYEIDPFLFKYDIIEITNFSSETQRYSLLRFNETISFLTGDIVSYSFTGTQIEGLDTNLIYYIEVVGEDKRTLRLYPSPSLIGTNNYIEFGSIETDISQGSHSLYLYSQREPVIYPQKLLRKFNTNFNDDNVTESFSTPVGPIGMLVNGVEIYGYKTNDKIHYGPIEKVQVLNGGSGYDVISPPLLEVSYGEAKIQPIVVGSVEKVLVSKQNFNIGDDVKVSISGGNGSGAILEPVIKPYQREVNFDARTIENGGGIDVDLETITFLTPHSFSESQEIIYDSNGNNELGISSYQGSNADSEQTLVSNSSYYVSIINDRTIQLYPSLASYSAGINTVGISTIGNSGIHKFKTKAVNTLSEIVVVDPGSNYTNRKLRVKSSGISTYYSKVFFDDHGFSEGDLIEYSTEDTEIESSSIIVGLSTLNRYYVINSTKNEFQLADAGIGGTSRENYEKRKILTFGSTGSGYQVFKYPDISLNISYSIPGIGTTSAFGIIEATPIVRGKIDGIYVYENGIDYGSTILNLKNSPKINIKNGRSAQFKPLISSGSIISVQVQYGGLEYYSYPDLVVNSSSGQGAILKPIIIDNKIVRVDIINPGSGYDERDTSIIAKPAGSNCNLNPIIRSLTLNSTYKFGKFEQTNITNQFYRKPSNELASPSNNGLQYSINSYSTKLANIFNDDGQFHSPIIGWAFDGNPIYGPYGYSDPENSSSAVKELIPGYTKVDVYNRPSGFDDEFFIEDFVFDGSGDLDQYNGRYCKTPEFPNGRYVYFASIKNDPYEDEIVGRFPYFIGPNYRSYVNLIDLQNLNQEFDFNSSNLIRNTLPYKINDKYASYDFILESNESLRQNAVIESVNYGKIDSFNIINGGVDYKVGDRIVFEGNDVDILAKVSEISGEEIFNITTIEDIYDNSILSWQDSKTLKVSISPNHDLENGDTVILSGLSTNLSNINGDHKISVVDNVSYLNEYLDNQQSTGIVTTISLSYIPENISIGSTITIDDEYFKVLNIYESISALKVLRSEAGVAHTISTQIKFSPDTFTIDFESEYFDSQVNKKVYFNPTESIGVGTTPGITTRFSYYINNVLYQTDIPTQSIYIPNHPFKTNQEVILSIPPNLGPSSKFTVRNVPNGLPFTLPLSGNSQKLYIINHSKDYIGIVTNVGLTTSTKGLFFTYAGLDNSEYSIESNYDNQKCKVQRIKSTVLTSTPHNLSDNDIITLSIKPSATGVASTTFYVKYNDNNKLILINPIDISSAINTEDNSITYSYHGYSTGEKVYYDSTSSVALGLSKGIYYVLKVNDNNFKLCETYIDSVSNSAKVVEINSTGGSGQTISKINPKIQSIRNNNLVFDLSDSSLDGYDMKIYYDQTFDKEFVSDNYISDFNIVRFGTPGVTPDAKLTVHYSDNIPNTLYYNLVKSGITTTVDKSVTNYSRIEFIDSFYSGKYSVYNSTGLASTSFNISLLRRPEVFSYTQDDCDLLKYKTNSKTSSGSIEQIKIYSNGSEYVSIPNFAGFTTASSGIGAYIVPQSKDIGIVKEIRIASNGFDYPSDRTLRPTASIPVVATLKDSQIIDKINVIYGGNKYLSEPNVVVLNTETSEVIDTGILSANISGLSVGSIDVEVSPKQLPSIPVTIRTINNTNGIPISEIQSSSSGIVTCILTTPITGFSTDPFSFGDKIFVEGIQKYGSDGTGFNSSDYGYQFFEVLTYDAGSNPGRLVYDLSSFTSNPGIAKTIQDSFATIVNYDDYPQFEVIQKPGRFFIGETILRYNGNDFEEVDLTVKYESETFLRLSGTYVLTKNDIIRGKESFVEAKISDVSSTNARFNVAAYSQEILGWVDNTGKLNESTQVIEDNDYYQNLAYSIKSTKEWNSIESVVNDVLHTSGLKNFSDTQILSTASLKKNTSFAIDSQISIINDNINDIRVDTINNFDLVVDTNILSN